MPGRHGPALVWALLPSVMGSMLEFMQSDHILLHLYISGDTLMIDELKEIRKRTSVHAPHFMECQAGGANGYGR